MSTTQQAEGEAPAQQKERPSAASPSDAKLEHLLKAGEHLEAAGLEEEAKKCRQLADEEREAILTRIRALEAEIERLRGATGGVQQVLLNVTIVEISRTKLRKLGFDWAAVTGEGSVIQHSTPGILAMPATKAGDKKTFKFGIVDSDDAFSRILMALRQGNLARLVAEPTLVTVSGRPAFAHMGGEVPVPVCQADGTAAVEYKQYGTQIDVVPIVLREGRLRMEVRVRVTELDWTTGMEIDGKPVPAFNTREIDTGVELGAGQTLLIRGLVQWRTIGEGKEAPGAGKGEESEEEVELLVLVTPELVDAMDAGGTLGPQKPVSPAVPVPSTAPRPGTVAPPPKPAASRPRPYLSGYVSPAVPRPGTARRFSTAPAPADKPAPPPTPYRPTDRYGAPANSSSAAENAP